MQQLPNWDSSHTENIKGPVGRKRKHTREHTSLVGGRPCSVAQVWGKEFLLYMCHICARVSC
jgi:hypothetical protein